MKKKLRVGIIGYGTQGSYYATLIEEGKVPSMELTAISARNPKQAASIQEEKQTIRVFTDYREMIDSGLVEAVVIVVPPFFHPEIAIYALEKNVHVLNEKPAGVFTKQVKKLNEVAATNKESTYAMFFNQRINPLYQKIKKIIEEDEIGTIRSINWIITNWYRPQAYYDQSEWRGTWGADGGGVLLNQAAHQLDLLQWMTGVPKSVYAKVKFGNYRDIVVEDDVTAIMEYPNGATGVFVTNTHDLMGTDRLEIVGDKGKIVVEDSKNATIKRLTLTEQEINKKTKATGTDFIFPDGKMKTDFITEEQITADTYMGGKHAGVLENFSRHILYGEELLAPGAEGINGVRLMNAMYLSSWLDKEISLESFDDDQYIEWLNDKIKQEGKYKTW